MTSQTSVSRSGVLVAVLTLALLGCHGQDRPAATAGAASDPWPQVTWKCAQSTASQAARSVERTRLPLLCP